MTAADTTYIGPLGQWQGTVTHDEHTDEFALTFAADGTVSLRTPFSTGEGTWTPTGARSFSYTIKEVFDNRNVMPGWIAINVDATHYEGTYTGSGLCYIHAPDGTVVGSTFAHVTGHQHNPPEPARS
ncbi:hypothetical protein [Streptomyces sp. NPDC058326]|uniref:hypothetical protein n=1 Tax=Streptomyces sp. NPDC058326 TaxID=3346447 RepID=UPI0036F07F7D